MKVHAAGGVLRCFGPRKHVYFRWEAPYLHARYSTPPVQDQKQRVVAESLHLLDQRSHDMFGLEGTSSAAT